MNERREMKADYSGGQSSPRAVAPRGKKEGTVLDDMKFLVI
jgi:hypothetical protein